MEAWLRDRVQILGSGSNNQSFYFAELTKVASFLSQNAENPIPVSEIEQQDPFAPQGETKKIPKPLASPNLVDAGFPAWAVKWADELSQDDLFDYANVSIRASCLLDVVVTIVAKQSQYFLIVSCELTVPCCALLWCLAPALLFEKLPWLVSCHARQQPLILLLDS